MLKNIRFFIVIFIILNACVEPYEFEVRGTQEVMVIDASFTNEKRAHQVKLSIAYPITESDEKPLLGARVWITDEQNNQIDFQESQAGLYLTKPDIQGIIGQKYVLHIQTNDGKQFISSPELLRNAVEIDSIYGEYDARPSTEEAKILSGVQFFIANHNDQDDFSNYRFELEEDYEVSVPFPRRWIWNIETQQLEVPPVKWDI